MTEGTRITRTVETELPVDELWSLVADGAGWATWMVDSADVDVAPGATGTVVDDGVARAVRIDRVEPAQRVDFTWWPRTRPDQESTVELVVLPARSGSRLHVTETYRQASAAGAAIGRIGWEVRALLLWARGHAVLGVV